MVLLSVPLDDKIRIPLAALKTMDAECLLLRLKNILLFFITILSKFGGPTWDQTNNLISLNHYVSLWCNFHHTRKTFIF